MVSRHSTMFRAMLSMLAMAFVGVAEAGKKTAVVEEEFKMFELIVEQALTPVVKFMNISQSAYDTLPFAPHVSFPVLVASSTAGFFTLCLFLDWSTPIPTCTTVVSLGPLRRNPSTCVQSLVTSSRPRNPRASRYSRPQCQREQRRRRDLQRSRGLAFSCLFGVEERQFSPPAVNLATAGAARGRLVEDCWNSKLNLVFLRMCNVCY